AAFLALLLGGLVLFWPTANGTVRLEINDDRIEALFTRSGAVIKGADKKHDILLTAGEHGLKIKRGDLEFETDQFILKRGETVTLKIEWFKEGKLQVLQGDKLLGEKKLPPPPSQYALEFDGKGDHVAIPTLTYTAPQPITLEAWVTARRADAIGCVLTLL